jgi:hypothetical protein
MAFLLDTPENIAFKNKFVSLEKKIKDREIINRDLNRIYSDILQDVNDIVDKTTSFAQSYGKLAYKRIQKNLIKERPLLEMKILGVSDMLDSDSIVFTSKFMETKELLQIKINFRLVIRFKFTPGYVNLTTWEQIRTLNTKEGNCILLVSINRHGDFKLNTYEFISNLDKIINSCKEIILDLDKALKFYKLNLEKYNFFERKFFKKKSYNSDINVVKDIPFLIKSIEEECFRLSDIIASVIDNNSNLLTGNIFKFQITKVENEE